jgi:hypothetical protein
MLRVIRNKYSLLDWFARFLVYIGLLGLYSAAFFAAVLAGLLLAMFV